jgi:DNA-binding phage protein
MKVTTSPYDVAEHLRTPEEMAAYLEPASRRLMEMPPS